MRILHWLRRRLLVFLFWGLTWGLAILIVLPPLARRKAVWLLEILDPEPDDAND